MTSQPKGIRFVLSAASGVETTRHDKRESMDCCWSGWCHRRKQTRKTLQIGKLVKLHQWKLVYGLHEKAVSNYEVSTSGARCHTNKISMPPITPVIFGKSFIFWGISLISHLLWSHWTKCSGISREGYQQADHNNHQVVSSSAEINHQSLQTTLFADGLREDCFSI